MTVIYLETMVRLAAEITGAHGGSLFLSDGRVLRPYVIYNLPQEYIAGVGPVRVGTQCCGRAVESKRPWIVADMLEDPLFAAGREGAARSAIRAAFSVPVLEGGEAIAALACHFTSPHTPSALDIERNQHFARLIAITLKGGGDARAQEPVYTWSAQEQRDRAIAPLGG
jgi:GAF domain-containing protein